MCGTLEFIPIDFVCLHENTKKVLLPLLLEAENSGMIIQVLLNLSYFYVHNENSRTLDHY